MSTAVSTTLFRGSICFSLSEVHYRLKITCLPLQKRSEGANMHPILPMVLVPKIIAAKSRRDLPQVSKLMLAAWLQRDSVGKYTC